jgi:hypothetical protein
VAVRLAASNVMHACIVQVVVVVVLHGTNKQKCDTSYWHVSKLHIYIYIYISALHIYPDCLYIHIAMLLASIQIAHVSLHMAYLFENLNVAVLTSIQACIHILTS